MTIDPINTIAETVQTPAVIAQSETVVAQSGSAAEIENFSAATKIKSVSDLKEKAGKVYKELMRSIANTIISDMRKSQQRIKKINRGNG